MKVTRLGKMVLSVLARSDSPVKQEDLVAEMGINVRSVRYALKILHEQNLMHKRHDLHDLRSFYYQPTEQGKTIVSS